MTHDCDLYLCFTPAVAVVAHPTYGRARMCQRHLRVALARGWRIIEGGTDDDE